MRKMGKENERALETNLKKYQLPLKQRQRTVMVSWPCDPLWRQEPVLTSVWIYRAEESVPTQLERPGVLPISRYLVSFIPT